MATIHGDSPTRSRHTQSVQYQSSYGADSRMTLTHDIPMVPEVSLTTLMDSVLPTVPSNQINEVCEKLIANGRIETPNEKPKWECLPEDPKAAGRVKQEPKTFQFFEKIAQAIEESCSNTTESRLKLKVTGPTIPFSCRCNTSRPDGYFLMDTVNPPSTDKWSDISVPMEFENGDKEKDKIDNYAKVMWSMQHAMRGDPRRRYMHGFTCENTKARLWYNDRCDVVASEEFDINEDWRYLVRIILSILLATDAELGYDPSVVTHSPDNPGSEAVYDITIYNSNTKDPTVYRTIEIISDVGADSMVGRGTRVWSAQKVENGEPVGSVYVLKSIWVHQDRLTEHVVLEDIRAQQPTYSKYFLTPVDHGFAPLDPSDASIIFDTHSPLGRQRDLELTGKVLKTCPPPGWTPGIKTPSTSRNSVGRPGGIPNAPEEGFRDFRQLSNDPRQNYLIVFKERGKPVHELDKFTDVYTAIEGGWKGLHAVHICGYVHRDVSSGNILLLPPSDGHDTRGALMDLEYNKKVKDMTAPYDVRVGTEAFMATEVARMGHHRLSEMRSAVPKQEYTSFEVISAALDEALQSGSEQNPPRQGPPLPPFCHNPLHDMESIWWLCVWTMLWFVPPGRVASEYQAAYRLVFSNGWDAKTRFISVAGAFADRTSHLLSDLRPLVWLMDLWRDSLNASYSISYRQHNTSETIQIDFKAIKFCYEQGCKFLLQLRDASKKLSFTLVPLSKALEPSTSVQAGTFAAAAPIGRFSGGSSRPAKKRRIDG